MARLRRSQSTHTCLDESEALEELIELEWEGAERCSVPSVVRRCSRSKAERRAPKASLHRTASFEAGE